MPTPPSARSDQPNTYVIQDRSNTDELARLLLQDTMITTGMGGVLPEQPDPGRFRRVLDVGCGSGGWLRETARAYASMTHLVGVDISRQMVEFARSQARAGELSGRVTFEVMDALRILEFPQHFFDLVNHRSAASWLRTWDWPRVLQEYQRVCRPGGVIRVTEINFTMESPSPAYNQLNELLLQALYRAGYYDAPEGDAIVNQLAHLLTRSDVQDVQTRICTLEYPVGTPEWHPFFEDARSLFRAIVPFLRKWIYVPENYEMLYQQMLQEMQQPNFVGKLKTVTAWGRRQ
jgi:ubiquinone/menaquinone biosynthesis C-methylase UbiE